MHIFELSEGTAARRRLSFRCVSDVASGLPMTGLTFAAGELKWSENGAAEVNVAGTVTEVAGGIYYYEATAAELDTFGMGTLRVSKTDVRQDVWTFQVVAFDPYAATNLGLTDVAAIKAKTDSLTFTVANQVDANALTVGAGAVNAAAIATGAVDADALATDAVQEIADGVLKRKLDSTGDGTDTLDERTVRSALRGVRNKRSIAGATLTITKEDDATTAWTAAIGTTAVDPITSIDPA
jgi:hypothetical protein